MKKGFTLIELLIVVLIIAILAAIAVPNFLEFQTRAKISRAKADMRSLRIGLEAYFVDNNIYPLDYDEDHPAGPNGQKNDYQSWIQITTPIAYMTSVIYAPWLIFPPDDHNPYSDGQEVYVYWGPGVNNNFRWQEYNAYFAVVCGGPDFVLDFRETYIGPLYRNEPEGLARLYDPSNGTVSSGDIIMTARNFHN